MSSHGTAITTTRKKVPTKKTVVRCFFQRLARELIQMENNKKKNNNNHKSGFNFNFFYQTHMI